MGVSGAYYSEKIRRTYAKTESRGYSLARVEHNGAVVRDGIDVGPGKYRLLHRAAPKEPNGGPPAAWNANERAKLRKEAEAMKVEIELKPCQRVTDQVVKYVRRP
jgi:hypothetical protein